MRELIGPLRKSLSDQIRCAWCTLAETRGSTPQKAGAAMLVTEDGRQFGTLGGGCVEAEVRRAALASLDGTTPQLLDRTLDSEAAWADGLICGGRMKFVVQSVSDSPTRFYFGLLADLIETGAGGCEIVALPDLEKETPVPRGLFDASGRLVASLHFQSGDKETFVSLTPNLDDRPKPKVVHGVAILPILPRCRLVLAGAGHVSQAVAELAARVDFDLCIVDDREQFANRDRFPAAGEILVGPFDNILRDLAIGPRDYCLVVTRGHGHDAEALLHLATKPARYIGLIGSKRKIRMILEDLERTGIPQKTLARVHAPIGIDIGSQTVAEIAVSIVAQLIGHRNLGAAHFPPPRNFT